MKTTAPAKLNLTLDILGKRPDGYHNMRMVMQSISLADTVTLEEQPEGFTLRTEGFSIAEGTKSLEERTAEAFFSAVGQPMPGLRVTLEKKTPLYAGLGGGSADVAALLRLLREQFCPGLPTEELERIGLRVGSDVPFCVRGGTCLAEGRGEILTDLPPLPPCVIVLCKPDFGLPTPALFALADSVPVRRRPDTEAMMDALRRGSLDDAANLLCNVFEEVLPERYGEVFAIRCRLLELGALNASMSGSGPTVFALFRDEETAKSAAESMGRTYRETWLARPVPRIRGVNPGRTAADSFRDGDGPIPNTVNTLR